jgi:hypothetical protein
LKSDYNEASAFARALPNVKIQWRLLLCIASVIVGLTVLFKSLGPEAPADAASQIDLVRAPTKVHEPVSGAAASRSSSSAERLQQVFGCLGMSDTAATTRIKLDELRAAFSTNPRDEAVSAIRNFLDSRVDIRTELGFKVAGDGLLSEAPTWRTFLLDELGRVDPPAAGEYAKIVLATMDSPDEWAVALRNLARADSSAEGRGLLEEKLMAMLRHEPWQREPSVGFLEAFDATVFIGGTNFVPTLSDLVRKTDNPGLGHAAFLALDRLVIADPINTLRVLKDNPDLMEGREATRANYFARLEVGDPRQREILENYLTSSAISPAEIDIFAGIFPNANYMVSNNLLTHSSLPDGASLVKRDAESLNVVRSWASDPRFAGLRPSLHRSLARLEEFVAQASHSR